MRITRKDRERWREDEIVRFYFSQRITRLLDALDAADALVEVGHRLRYPWDHEFAAYRALVEGAKEGT